MGLPVFTALFYSSICILYLIHVSLVVFVFCIPLFTSFFDLFFGSACYFPMTVACACCCSGTGMKALGRIIFMCLVRCLFFLLFVAGSSIRRGPTTLSLVFPVASRMTHFFFLLLPLSWDRVLFDDSGYC